ncbi:MAG: hypothetical protein ACK5P0_00310 [bacterium]
MKQSLAKIFEDTTPEDNTFTALRKYVRGKIDRDELIESDYFIMNVFSNEKRGYSEVEFEFDDEQEVASLLGISVYDVYFYNEVMQNEVAEIFDFDYLENDFLEGSSDVWSWLNQENTKLLVDIGFKFVDDDVDEIDFSDWEMMKEMNGTLYDSFPSTVRRMIATMEKYLNAAATIKAKKSIKEDLVKELKRTGFHVEDDLKIMTSTVTNLIVKYAENDMLNADLKTLVEKVLRSAGGWYPDWRNEPYYYVQSDDFDFNGYNREMKDILEKIKEVTNDY